jgi:pimeloyl-ACP methyl ester carboxylesterase
MNRSFYSFAILFTALHLIVGLFLSLIFFGLPGQVYTFQSFPFWIIGSSIITIISSFLALKYYHHKKYWFTFGTALVSIVAFVSYAIVLYIMLTAKEMINYWFIVVLLELSTMILYAISLIVSKAGERHWLKTAGVCLFVIALMSLLGEICVLISKDDLELREIETNVYRWTSLIGSLVPLLFIINFLHEREKAEKANASWQKDTNGILGGVALITLVPILFLGEMLIKDRKKAISENIAHAEAEKKDIERAQAPAQLYEPRTFVNATGQKLLYRLKKPIDFDPEKKYPLVVILHHGGLHGNDNVRQVTSEPAPLLSSFENRTKYPAFLFVPQCPKGACWGGIHPAPSVDLLVFQALRALEKEFNIDKTRRYVAGSSMGGYGSWHFICSHPEMFAAAIPICGGGDPKLARKIVDVPVWVFHGENDKNVPVKLARDMIQAIKKAGGNPKYTEFAGQGHNIWIGNTPGVIDWLFAQKRK